MDLAGGAQNARWAEFVRIYEEPMRAFLAARFPTVEADDVLQETMIALMRIMPGYHYTPDRNGHFRNYLVGIVRHKALDALRREAARNALKTELATQERNRPLAPPAADTSSEEGDWRHSAMEAALDQVLADDSISARTREVFRHVALMHEPPEAVAQMFGIERNNVDQIKSRLIARLARLVKAMTA